MDCWKYRDEHPAETEEARGHLEACADCRSFRRTWDLIREYPPIEPGPSFMQGVRARLAPSILRFTAPLAAMAAALLVGIILLLATVPGTGPAEVITEEQVELAENLELLENLDLLRALEFTGESVSPLLENPK